ncbi:MAG: hypothetical protein AAF467_21940 [Actinomycetota bacterium]
MDWRTLRAEGPVRRAIYHEYFPRQFDHVCAAAGNDLTDVFTEAEAAGVLNEFVDRWNELDGAAVRRDIRPAAHALSCEIGATGVSPLSYTRAADTGRGRSHV